MQLANEKAEGRSVAAKRHGKRRVYAESGRTAALAARPERHAARERGAEEQPIKMQFRYTSERLRVTEITPGKTP